MQLQANWINTQAAAATLLYPDAGLHAGLLDGFEFLSTRLQTGHSSGVQTVSRSFPKFVPAMVDMAYR